MGHRKPREFYSDGDASNEDDVFRVKGQKACRVCHDFTSWVKNKKSNNDLDKNKPERSHNANACPLDGEELGHTAWSFLHTLAAYYPEKPTDKHKSNMNQFISLFSQFYPCEDCAKDFQKSIEENPPVVQSCSSLSLWFCQQHNLVNQKLGKPLFDCSKVLERWRDGWSDGSCD